MTVTMKMNFTRERSGRKRLDRAASAAPAPAERVPYASRLMALAIHLDGLIRAGKVKDYAEIARLGHVSRARVTQIMGLLNLAPDIQEQILFLRVSRSEREPIKERHLRQIVSTQLWMQQTLRWHRLIEGR